MRTQAQTANTATGGSYGRGAGYRVRVLMMVIVTLNWCTAGVIGQPKSMTDGDISEAVTDALVQDPGVNASLIDVDTSEGVVTVSGTVGNVLARDRATKVAETVAGAAQLVELPRIPRSRSNPRPATEVPAGTPVACSGLRLTHGYREDRLVRAG